MKYPKSLPWHAARANVTLDRAEALWCDAVRCATLETGVIASDEYWGAIMGNFLSRLEDEERFQCSGHITPLLRCQRNIVRQAFGAAEDVSSLLLQQWARNTDFIRHAA